MRYRAKEDMFSGKMISKNQLLSESEYNSLDSYQKKLCVAQKDAAEILAQQPKEVVEKPKKPAKPEE